VTPRLLRTVIREEIYFHLSPTDSVDRATSTLFLRQENEKLKSRWLLLQEEKAKL